MGVEENKATVRRLFTAMEQGNQAARSEIFHPDFVGIHVPGGVLQRPGDPRLARSDGVGYRQAFPDWTVTIDLLIGEGDYVVARWTSRGTHTGVWEASYGHFPPTGRRIAHSGVNIYRLQDGKIIENWLHQDERHLIQQLSGEATAEESMGEAPSSR